MYVRASVYGTYLCTGDTDLWSRIDVDAAVTLSTDGATYCIGDSDDEGTTLLTVSERH